MRGAHPLPVTRNDTLPRGKKLLDPQLASSS